MPIETGRRRPPSLRPWTVGVVLLLLILPSAVPANAAQALDPEFLSGRVIDSELGEPVSGALVSLVDVDGELRRSVLTGPDGRYALRLPGPGTWSIRVARLAYGETNSEPVEVAPGEARSLDITITSTPLVLDAVEIRAEATGLCRRLDPEEGSLRVRLWQEARSALRVVAWAEEEERYEFELSRWTRTTDLVSNRVIEEEHGGRTNSFRPFETAPVEELLEEGWVRGTDDAEVYDYYGLDARVLLSDGFERAHCFEIRQDPATPDRVGLGFAPAVERDRAGVVGVLWMDRETMALEALEFHYTQHPHEPPIPRELSPLFNGRADFRELPDGGWIVDRWSLRLPQYQILLGSGHRSVGAVERGFAGEFAEIISEQPRWWRDIVREARLGSVEEGGELMGVRTPDGTWVPPRERAALVGVVHDSTRAAGLAGAEVFLVGTDHRARTDRTGAFRLEIPLDGRYLVSFEHPRLDTLGIEELPSVEVGLERGLSTRIELAVPSERTLVALRCEREPGTGPDGILWGRVIDPASGDPIPGVTVRLQPDGAEGPIHETVSDPEGEYRFCSVPPEVRFEAVPRFLGIEGTGRGIRIAQGAVVAMELPLRIGAVGELRGIVREGETGPPIGSATVLAIGEGERRSAVTDEEGRFVFSEIPAGAWELVVSHVAFRRLETDLQVEGGGRTTRLTVRLLRDAIALDPVEVVVDSRPSWGVLAGVYDRRDDLERLGIGTFYDRTAIERAGTNRIANLVARAPGARVVASRPGATEVRIHRTNDCHPALYVDGMRYLLDGIDRPSDGFVETIDDVVPLSLIEMIEVYRGAAQLPIEFASDRAAQCGAVAIWTRRGH